MELRNWEIDMITYQDKIEKSKIENKKMLSRMIFFLLNNSLYVNGSKTIHAKNHL